MTKSEINTLLLSEKREWRELFYLKLDRNGMMRLRTSLPTNQSPVQIVLDQQSQLFKQIIEPFDANYLHRKAL